MSESTDKTPEPVEQKLAPDESPSPGSKPEQVAGQGGSKRQQTAGRGPDARAALVDKMARTILEHGPLEEVISKDFSGTEAVTTSSAISSPEQASAASIPASKKTKGDYRAAMVDKVARTNLDHSSFMEVVSKNVAQQELKLAELLAQPAAPAKPFVPIDNFKLAAPCGSTCKPDAGRISYCELCHQQVYDFSGMQLPEAEETIFKRENRERFVLYKRADGRFLTSNCPVGVRKRILLLTAASAGGTLLLILFVLLLLSPRPAPQPQVLAPSQNAASQGRAAVHNGAASQNAAPGQKNPGTSSGKWHPRELDGSYSPQPYAQQAPAGAAEGSQSAQPGTGDQKSSNTLTSGLGGNSAQNQVPQQTGEPLSSGEQGGRPGGSETNAARPVETAPPQGGVLEQSQSNPNQSTSSGSSAANTVHYYGTPGK